MELEEILRDNLEWADTWWIEKEDAFDPMSHKVLHVTKGKRHKKYKLPNMVCEDLERGAPVIKSICAYLFWKMGR